MSSIREKIKSKLKQIKHICADAHKNVVVVAGGMKSKGGKRKSTNTTRRRPRVRKTRMA
jgi:peptide subunit release factor 1 (eRF1)